MERLSWIIWWGGQCSHNSPYKRETEGSRQRGDMMIKTEFQVMSDRDHKPKMQGISRDWKRQGSGFFPRASWRNAAPP